MDNIVEQKEIIIKGLNNTQVAIVNALVEEVKKQIKPFSYQMNIAQTYIDKHEPRLEALKLVEHNSEVIVEWIEEIEKEIERNKEIVKSNKYNIDYIEKVLLNVYSHIKETITDTQAIFEYDEKYFNSILDFAVLFTDMRFED